MRRRRSPPATGHALSPEERRAWDEDGFFIRPRVFGAGELRELRAAAERVAQRAQEAARTCEKSYEVDGNRYCEAAGATIQFEHRPDSATIRVIEPFHHLEPALRAADRRSAAGRADARAGGQPERVALFTDKLNFKRPREGSRFRWHQDSPYWAHFARHLDRLPNVMLALDDATEHNGCLRVIAGSHRRGLLPGSRGEEQLGAALHGSAVLRPLAPAGGRDARRAACSSSARTRCTARRRTTPISRGARCSSPISPPASAMFKRDAVRNAGRAGSVREAADVGDHVADLRVAE